MQPRHTTSTFFDNYNGPIHNNTRFLGPDLEVVSSFNLIMQPFLITFWGQIPLFEPKECTRLDETMIKFDLAMIIIACYSYSSCFI